MMQRQLLPAPRWWRVLLTFSSSAALSSSSPPAAAMNRCRAIRRIFINLLMIIDLVADGTNERNVEEEVFRKKKG